MDSQNEIDMKIPADRLKLLCLIVNLIAKIGKDLIIEVDGEEQTVCFRALNDAKSAFVSIEFVENFFSSIQMPHSTFSCKIPAKPMCSILSNLKNVENLRLFSVQVGSDNFLVVQLLLTYKILKTYRFHYQECEIVNAVFDEDDAHIIQVVPKLFSNLLGHLHKAPELVIAATPTNFTVSSFYVTKAGESKQHLSSGLCVNVSEFDYYEYKRTLHSQNDEVEGMELILCSKEVLFNYNLSAKSATIF